jgi:hypothetical protein
VDEKDGQVAACVGLPQCSIDVLAPIVALVHSPDLWLADENVLDFFGHHLVLHLKLLDNLLQSNKAHYLHARSSL